MTRPMTRPMTRSKPPPSLSAKFFEAAREEEVSGDDMDSSDSESTDSNYDSDDSSDWSSDEDTSTDDGRRSQLRQQQVIQKQQPEKSPEKGYPTNEEPEPDPIPILAFKDIMDPRISPPRPQGWLEFTDLRAPGKPKWELGYFVAGPVQNMGLAREGSAMASRVVEDLGRLGRLVCYKDRAAVDGEDQGLKDKDWPLSGMNVLYKEMGQGLKAQLFRDGWSKRWEDVLHAANPATGKIKKDDLETLLKQLHPKPGTPKADKAAAAFLKAPSVVALADEDGLVQLYDPFSFMFWLCQQEGDVGMQLRCGCVDVAEAWVRTLRQWQYYHLWSSSKQTPLWSSSDVHMACAVFCTEDEAAKAQLLKLCTGGGQGKQKIDGMQLRLLADCDTEEHTSQHLDTLIDTIVEEHRLPDSEKKARKLHKGYILNLARSLGDAAQAGHVEFDDLPESGGKPGFPFVAPTIVVKAERVGIRKGETRPDGEKENKTRYTIFAQPEAQPAHAGSLRMPTAERNLRGWNALYNFDVYLAGLRKQCAGKSTLAAALKAKPKFPPSRHIVGETTPDERQQGLLTYFGQLSLWAKQLRDDQGFALHGVHNVAAFLMPASGMTIPADERENGLEEWFPVMPVDFTPAAEPEPEPSPSPRAAADGPGATAAAAGGNSRLQV